MHSHIHTQTNYENVNIDSSLTGPRLYWGWKTKAGRRETDTNTVRNVVVVATDANADPDADTDADADADADADSAANQTAGLPAQGGNKANNCDLTGKFKVLAPEYLTPNFPPHISNT